MTYALPCWFECTGNRPRIGYEYCRRTIYFHAGRECVSDQNLAVGGDRIGDTVAVFPVPVGTIQNADQPADADAFAEEGFLDVRPVDDEVSFRGVTIHRTPGRHGTGQLADDMGPVSGFVFDADETLYLGGDTIWYDTGILVPEDGETIDL